MAITTVQGQMLTAPLTLTGNLTFSDSSVQTAAASPYVLKNRIINGDMRISQRNTTSSVTPASGDFTLDRWSVALSQASKFTVQQNAGSVTPPVGFSNYLGITSSSAYSITAGDYFYFRQPIEGFNTSDLAWGTANAKTVTLSFQVYSSLTGTFGGSLENSAYTRNYPFSYSIPTANTWTTISITIAGDTSGTWVGATNGAGLRVNFGLGVSSQFSGTAGVWAAGDIVSTTGATSVVGTSGATFYITGVQLEIGTSATPFERRLYDKELISCQRYFAKVGPTTDVGYAQGISNTTSQGYFVLHYKVTMRTTPTFAYISSLAMTDNQNYNSTVSAIAGFYGCPDSGRIALNGAASMTQYRPATLVNIDSTGSYTLSAEL